MRVKDKTLAKLMADWFERTKRVGGQFRQNPVGVLIKTRLKKMGHWKYGRRGDPRKGYEVANRGRRDW